MKKIIMILMTLFLMGCNDENVVADPFENSVVEVTLPTSDLIEKPVETVVETTPDVSEVPEAETIVIEEVEISHKDKNRAALSKDDVLWLQESLKIAGFYTQRDGSFGNGTQGRLEDYQTANDLSVGLYDELTKEALVLNLMNKEAPRLGSDMVLINKDYYLPSAYVPENLRAVLVKSNKAIELPDHVATQVEKLFKDAEADGIILSLVSGYRSYDYQEGIFSRRVNNNGFEEAEQVVAIPGESEHQTGLAMDVSCESMGFGLDQSFDETEEYQWLIEHASNYGFILRYFKDKSDITKYVYEPWHYRYIGNVEEAKKIMAEHIVLEEYFMK